MTCFQDFSKKCSFCHAGKHLVLVTDPEGAGDKYAFDNPCFKGK
jgi:hypothetical protein